MPSARSAKGHYAVAAAILLLTVVIVISAATDAGAILPAIRTSAVAALLVVVWILLSQGDRRTVLNPALLLAAQAILLYSALLWGSLWIGSPDWIRRVRIDQLRGYLGSRSELLVLGFGTLSLVVALASLHWSRSRATVDVSDGETQGRDYVPRLALLCACAAAIFYAAENFSAVVRSFAAAGPGRQLHDIAAPIIAFGLAVAVHSLARGNRLERVAVAAAIAFCTWAMMQVMQAPVPVFMLLGLALLWLSVRPPTLRVALAALACLVGALGAVILVKTQIINERGLTLSHVTVGRTLVSKLIERQMESAGCLNHVVENQLSRGISGDPFYFDIAVVPRAVWPDKPSLSRGAEFAQFHCGIRISANKNHSETLTLLGEPILEAGATGLVVAELVILGIALLALRAVFADTALGPITVAALIPWIGTFQQHFALYIANGTKMFLAMVPFILLVAFARRRRRRMSAARA